VGGGRDGAVRGEDGVREFEEGVFSAMEAFVERAAEGANSSGRFHNAPIMRSRESSAFLAASAVETQAKKGPIHERIDPSR
jgi:hypothetical protein